MSAQLNTRQVGEVTVIDVSALIAGLVRVPTRFVVSGRECATRRLEFGYNSKPNPRFRTNSKL
jgi:hypothetical protein